MSNYDNNKDASRRKMHFSPNLLSCINNAVENKVFLTIEYDSRENDQTVRQIEPMALVYKNRKRNIVGWCHLRDAWRSFRLDRIEMIKVHRDTFEPRDGLNISEFEGDDDFNDDVER